MTRIRFGLAWFLPRATGGGYVERKADVWGTTRAVEGDLDAIIRTVCARPGTEDRVAAHEGPWAS